MIKMKHKKNKHIIFNKMFDIDESGAVSATDCTGLIPLAPHTKEELDAYNEIINYLPDHSDIVPNISDSSTDA